MIVGITGGIGAGKSTVSMIFKSFGVPIYEADFHSKDLLDSDPNLQFALVNLLGEKVVENKKINRAVMANLIFNDKDLLEKANALIHPIVGEHFKNWVAKQDSPYIIKEAAILYESGSYKDCDKVIMVSAPKEMRIKRVMARSAISRDEVLSRMNKQWPDQKKIELADFCIQNDEQISVIKQSLEIHKKLLVL